MQPVRVLGPWVRSVVHVHDPGLVLTLAQHAVAVHGEAPNREDGRGVVHAVRLLARLQGRALDLQSHDGADLAHNET